MRKLLPENQAEANRTVGIFLTGFAITIVSLFLLFGWKWAMLVVGVTVCLISFAALKGIVAKDSVQQRLNNPSLRVLDDIFKD